MYAIDSIVYVAHAEFDLLYFRAKTGFALES